MKFIKSSEKKECHYYSSLFYEASDKLQFKKEVVMSKILKLLGMVCSFHLDLENYEEPFIPAIILIESRSLSIEDLTDNDYEVLELIVDIIKDSELKARFADALWVG